MATTFEIFPAVGVARVGTSEEAFLAPEPGVAPPALYRDASGHLKRQAARFRVYECNRDAQGQLTSAVEVKPADAVITWTIHVANRKAASPKFLGGGPRNPGVPANELVIDPGPRTFTGPNQAQKVFDGGTFRGTPVTLGAARTDADGRLVVIGATGRADSVPAQSMPGAPPIENFAESRGWFDDIADGPVTATVQKTGQPAVAATGAWLMVGPPDFAPPVTNLVTMYDIAVQAAVDKNQMTPPAMPSFVRDIQPILARAVGYQWVNRRARQGHAGGMGGNFANNWPALANPATGPGLATIILERLRDPRPTPIPDPTGPSAAWMPRLHDDTNSSKVLPLTKVQYGYLLAWQAGNYTNDLTTGAPSEMEPEALTRTALEGCSGGAFYPGIEAGRIMRATATWAAPFRIDAATVPPGQLTAGNALPWQADFEACRWETQSNIGWWPAQRPDNVYLETAPTGTQVNWDAGVSGGAEDMIAKWHQLGILVEKVLAGQTRIVETERRLPR